MGWQPGPCHRLQPRHPGSGQSGSSIKPLVYALAFTQRSEDSRPRWRAHSTIRMTDVFKDTDGWYPRNVGEVLGHEQPAMALAWSQNVATASLRRTRASEMTRFARHLGFRTEGWRDELGRRWARAG